MTWRELVGGLNLAEAPCDDGAGGLYFSDMPDGGVFHLSFRGVVTPILAGRGHVGGIVSHADGGIVVSGPTLLHVNGAHQRVLFDPSISNAWSINDIGTDLSGRVYAGTLGASPALGPPERLGALWQVDAAGVVRKCYGDVEVTNGLAVSPDGAVLYHADTFRGVIWASSLSVLGSISLRREFFHAEDGTRPDGLAVDVEGGLWVASLSSYLLRLDARGDVIDRVDTPFDGVTTIAFVGPDLDRMVVCTGKQRGLGGSASIWTNDAPVAGLKLTPAVA